MEKIFKINGQEFMAFEPSTAGMLCLVPVDFVDSDIFTYNENGTIDVDPKTHGVVNLEIPEKAYSFHWEYGGYYFQDGGMWYSHKQHHLEDIKEEGLMPPDGWTLSEFRRKEASDHWHLTQRRQKSIDSNEWVIKSTYSYDYYEGDGYPGSGEGMKCSVTENSYFCHPELGTRKGELYIDMVALKLSLDVYLEKVRLDQYRDQEAEKRTASEWLRDWDVYVKASLGSPDAQAFVEREKFEKAEKIRKEKEARERHWRLSDEVNKIFSRCKTVKIQLLKLNDDTLDSKASIYMPGHGKSDFLEFHGKPQEILNQVEDFVASLQPKALSSGRPRPKKRDLT